MKFIVCFLPQDACSTIEEGCGVGKIAASGHGDGDVVAHLLTPTLSKRLGGTKALQW